MKRISFGVTLTLLLLTSLFALSLNIKPTKGAWSGTVRILSDGNIDPTDAPIENFDNVTYTLTDNITSVADGIIIEKDDIVIDGKGRTVEGQGEDPSKGVYLLNRVNVTIKGIVIKSFYYGIYLVNSSNNYMVGNSITANNGYGIEFYYSKNNSIFENIITDNDGYGIRLDSSSDNIISQNNITANGWDGVILYFSPNNTLSKNYIATNLHGIITISSSNNTISGNSITSNSVGIGLSFSANNCVVGNSITANSGGGITLISSSNNRVFESDIIGNGGHGVRLDSSSYNIISRNNIAANGGYGITLFSSSNNSILKNNMTNNEYGICSLSSLDNIIHHNCFIKNAKQAYNQKSVNIWNDNYPSGGNYWSDYSGADMKKGTLQDQLGSDGIGDTLYAIDEYNQDRYPLIYPYPIPWGDWQHYHNYTEIVDTLLLLNSTFSNVVDVFFIGKSWQNRDIYCIRLTNESYINPKPKVLFVGYHHARELISAELPLYFAVQAATNFGRNETITYLLNYSEIYIIPALNVDGFEIVSQNEWQRKNANSFDEDDDGLFDEDPPDDEDGDGYIENLFFWNGTHYWFIRWEGIDNDGDGLLNEDWIGGVDLNRNYGYQWDAQCQSGSPNPWDEDYRGPEPFSEPETQAIRDLAMAHNFTYAISFHSGTTLILYPWGYTNVPTSHDNLFKEIAGNLSSLTGAPYQQSAQLYTTSGVWDDWMYGNRSTYALTCEIYGNDSAWQCEPGPELNTWWKKGVFQYFNPDPSQIETVIQQWLPAFTYITSRAIEEFQFHNLVVTNVMPLKTIVGQGYPMRINITVINQGSQIETFNVTVYANATIIETREVTLQRETSANLTFTWNTSDFPKGSYVIWAYVEPVLDEVNIMDNNCTNGIVSVGIPGDVNPFDGYVGIDDIFSVALHLETEQSGPPNSNGRYYSPNFDINGDCYIREDDTHIVASHFGWGDF